MRDLPVHRRLLIAAIAPVYVALAYASRELGAFGPLSVWYAPAGLALGAFIVLGPEVFPAIALGEFVGGIVVFHVGSDFTPWQMLLNALGYAATYALVGGFLRHHGLVARVDTVRDAAPLIVAGIVFAPGIAAVFGVSMQVWAGFDSGQEFSKSVFLWWVGDAIGIATLTPALLVLALVTGTGVPRLVPPALRAVPVARLFAELALPSIAAVVVFLVSSGNPGLVGLVFAPAALLALRFGVAGTALSMAVLSPVVTVMANQKIGDVVVARADLQTLLLALMAVGYVLGLVVDERARITQYHTELGEIIEATTDLVTVVRRDGTVRYVNPAGRRALGLAPDGHVGALTEEALYPDGPNAQLATEARHAAERSGSWRGEVVLRGGDGDVAASKVVIAHYGRRGEPLRTTSILRDITEQRDLEAQLERGALYDELTGLPNRTFFFAQLDAARAQARASLTPMSLLVLMLDGYDALLDAFGMDACDSVLRDVSARLVGTAGAGATVGRIEGVHFGVLPALPMPEADAVRLGERLAAKVAEPVAIGDRLVTSSASVGVVEIAPDVSASELVRAADVAAHRAAARGGGRVVCHIESMTNDARSALLHDSYLREAVKSKAFSVVYQPVFEVLDRRPVAMEALVRFAPNQSPYRLIRIAERNGLIVDLGRAIIARACGEFAQWAGADAVPVSLHVNVSPVQISEPAFCDELHAALAATSIAPQRLTVEVTETVIGDPALAKRVFDELRESGIRIALDDFGAGYSSLATIDRLPIDEVKLDRSFTESLTVSPRAQALVGGTISLAHKLGLVVVAEGVEDEDQLDLLVELECDRVQGFLTGRPAPIDALDFC